MAPEILLAVHRTARSYYVYAPAADAQVLLCTFLFYRYPKLGMVFDLPS